MPSCVTTALRSVNATTWVLIETGRSTGFGRSKLVCGWRYCSDCGRWGWREEPAVVATLRSSRSWQSQRLRVSSWRCSRRWNDEVQLKFLVAKRRTLGLSSYHSAPHWRYSLRPSPRLRVSALKMTALWRSQRPSRGSEQNDIGALMLVPGTGRNLSTMSRCTRRSFFNTGGHIASMVCFKPLSTSTYWWLIRK